MAEVSQLDGTTFTPTDLSTTFSVTLDSSRSRSSNGRDRLDITRDDLEKCQLLHNIQLLKLELSQKQLIIDTSRNEQASQIEELRELLADARHEKKLLSLRVQSLSHGYEQELKRARERLQEERAKVSREREAQMSSQATMDGIRHEMESALASPPPLLDMWRYQELKSADSALLPVGEFVQLRFHELSNHLQQRCSELQQVSNDLNEQIKERDAELAASEENLVLARNRVSSLDQECSSLTQELKLVKTQVLEGNYKVDNFDAVKKERDTLRQRVEEQQNALSGVQVREKLATQELDKLTMELSAIQQSESLLQHDKEYLSRQVGELAQKVSLAEGRLEGVGEELQTARQAKEDLFHQLVKCREEQHVECDRRLEVEMEGLRARTAVEIDQLKAQTRELYERENRVLIEARDTAISERDRAKAAEKEASGKYEALMVEHHSLQASADKHLAELQGELQVVRFEKERTGLVHQETVKDLRHLQLEQEKLYKKVELLTQELHATETDKGLEVKQLEAELQGTRQQLLGYEKIEKELDEIVMQSAQMEHSCDAERVLFSYGFGTSVPVHSKRRLQQSVHLARRVLQLERINVSLRDQLKREEVRVSELAQELSQDKELLGNFEQPYNYLVSRVKEQKALLVQSKNRVTELVAELEAMKKERSALIETKNFMAADLERLLNHREEIHMMKALLLGNNNVQLNSTHQLHPPGPTYQPHPSCPIHQPHPPSCAHQPLLASSTHQSQSPSSTHQPNPTVFTKQQH